MVGILISLASFIGGIVFREIVNFFKESKLENKRFETEKKHFFAENFFPIYIVPCMTLLYKLKAL